MSEAENDPNWNGSFPFETPARSSYHHQKISTVRAIMKSRHDRKLDQVMTEPSKETRPQSLFVPQQIVKTVTVDEDSPDKRPDSENNASDAEEQDNKSTTTSEPSSSTSPTWAMLGDGAAQGVNESWLFSVDSEFDLSSAGLLNPSIPECDEYVAHSKEGESAESPINAIQLYSTSSKPVTSTPYMRRGNQLQRPLQTPVGLPNDDLRNRNMTLTKEIRFADQLCMEVTKEKELLEMNLNAVSNENGSLKQRVSALEKQLEQSSEELQESRIAERTAAAKLEGLESQAETSLALSKSLQAQLLMHQTESKHKMRRVYEAARNQLVNICEKVNVKVNDMDGRILEVTSFLNDQLDHVSTTSDSEELGSSDDSGEDTNFPPSLVGDHHGITASCDSVSQFSEDYSSESGSETSSEGRSSGNGSFPHQVPSNYAGFDAHMQFLTSPNAVQEEKKLPSHDPQCLSSEEESGQLLTQVKELQNENSELQQKVLAVESDLNRVEIELDESREKNKVLALDGELSLRKANQELSEVRSDRDQLRLSVSGLNTTVKELVNKLDTSKREHRAAQIQISNLATRTATCHSGRGSRTIPGLILKSFKQGKSKKQPLSPSKRSPYRDSKSPFKTSTYRETLALRSRVNGLVKERDSLCSQLDEVRNIMHNQEVVIQQASANQEIVDDLNKQLEVMESQLKASTTSLDELQSAYDSINNDKEMLSAKCVQAEESVSTLREKLEVVVKGKESLEVALRDCEEKRDVFEEQVSTLQDKIQLLSSELDASKEKHDKELEMLVNELNQSHQEATIVELEKRLGQGRQAYDAYIREKENRHKILSEIDGLVRRWDICSSNESLQGVDRGVANSAVSQSVGLGDTLGKLRSIEGELDTARRQLQSQDSEFELLEQENTTLRSKCSRLKGYVKKLTKKCQQWESYLHKEEQVLQGLKATTTAEKSKRSSLELAKSHLEAQLQGIARELSGINPIRNHKHIQ